MPRGGPRGGEKYRDEWQPVIGLLWDELDRNYWKEVVVTGPVQASKSFGALVIPTLRDIYLKVSPILGVPEADMFADKWDRDFKPVLDASDELRGLLPEVGSGRRGGRVRDRVTFTNGADLKVMSRGGQASNKAGFTTPRLNITEASGFSEASTSERDHEADSYRQLIARLGAFDLNDPRRRIIIEGTGTIQEHLPWKLRGEDDAELLISTRSKLLSPCPHCNLFISPEREHLVGWQTAENERQAYDKARFVCPECGEEIDDDRRRKSMQDVKIVHHGQEITPEGEVIGPLPEVFRLWFRWSAWHNCLINAGTTAVAEWAAARIEDGTSDKDNAERDLCQKKWAIPYKSKLGDNEPLNPTVISKKTDQWKRNILPHDTKNFAIGVDLGDWTGWWFGIAGREHGELECPTYGAFDIKTSKSDDLETRLKASLGQLFDTFEEGFAMEGDSGLILPDRVWVDIGYLPDWVADVVRERGKFFDNRFRCVRGRGASIKSRNGSTGGQYIHPKRVSRTKPRLGMQWFMEVNYERKVPEITFNADFWKLYLADRLRAEPGKKGSLTLFKAEVKDEHTKVSKHLSHEQYLNVNGVHKWVLTGDNHLNDAAAMACGALDECGYRIIDCPDQIIEIPTPNKVPAAANFYAKLAGVK
jgi:hypothetical protein